MVRQVRAEAMTPINYVWVGFSKDDGEPKAVSPVNPVDSMGLDWVLYFPADVYKKMGDGK